MSTIKEVTVYIPGCWDLLHVGHLNVLQAAKALGTRLIVGVASDKAVGMDKGKPPIITDYERARMVRSLKWVDGASVYQELEFITHLEHYHPDILAVGEQWGKKKRHRHAEEWVKANNKQMIKLPYTKGISTSEIIRRIQEQQR